MATFFGWPFFLLDLKLTQIKYSDLCATNQQNKMIKFKLKIYPALYLYEQYTY